MVCPTRETDDINYGVNQYASGVNADGYHMMRTGLGKWPLLSGVLKPGGTFYFACTSKQRLDKYSHQLQPQHGGNVRAPAVFFDGHVEPIWIETIGDCWRPK